MLSGPKSVDPTRSPGLSAWAFEKGVFFWYLEYLPPLTLSLLMSILPIRILVGV